jgi:hypothetical protein
VQFAARYAGCAMVCSHCSQALIVPIGDRQTIVRNNSNNKIKPSRPYTTTAPHGVLVWVATAAALTMAWGFGVYLVGLQKLDSAVIIEMVAVYVVLAAVGSWAALNSILIGERGRMLSYVCLAILLGPALVGLVIGIVAFFVAMTNLMFSFF